MIISTNNESTNLGTKINIENSITISSIGEYVLGSDFNAKCSRKGPVVLCNPNDVLIHINGTDVYEFVIINNWLSQDRNRYTQCYDNVIIRETLKQDYILKKDSLLIMSRERDIGGYSCSGGNRENARQVEINKGITRFKGFNKCGLQTSYLSIPGGYESHASLARMDIDDLDMDQAMMELDKYMLKKLKQPFNISALTDRLNATHNKILIEHHNLEGLHNSVKHLASLEALPNFQLSDMDPLGTIKHTKRLP